MSAGSASEARLGFAGQDAVGPWQGTTANRPAVASFSPAAGQTVTVGANTAVGGSGLSLTGSPLRGVVGQPIGLWSSWSGGGWSASFSSGSSRDRSADLRGVTFATPFGIGLEVTDLTEHGRVLGFGGGMAASGLRGGRTTLTTLVARRTVAGVSLTARATTGSTSVDGGGDGPIRFDGRIVSTAFAVEGARPLFGGLATLGLSSPLRVERARASLLVPVAYDLMSGVLAEEGRTFDLSPTARELDLEFGWSTALASTSTLRVGVARAFDAGHVRGASDVAAFFNFVVR